MGLAGFSLFINLLMLTGPLYMLQVYDRVLASQSVPTLVALTGLVAGLYLTLGLLDWIRASLFAEAGSRFEEQLGARASEAAIDANLRDPGAQTERPIRDLRALRKFFTTPALNVIFDAPFSPMFFIVLFMLHWSFGLWALFGAGVLLGIGLLNQRTSSGVMAEAEEKERSASLQAIEMVRSAEVMDAMGMRSALKSRWWQQFEGADQAITRSSKRLAAFTAGTKAFRLFMQSAILGIGAYLSIIQLSTPGAMVAASIIMGRAIAPIEQFVGQWRSIVSARAAWESLKMYLEHTPEHEDSMALPPIKGELSVENVFAGPPGSKAPLLRGLNFQLKAGELLGILGPSAAGKSTLARVLTGIWPTFSGTVRLDGADIHAWAREELGPQIGYLPQQVDLLSGTIRDNIARFNADADPQGVIAAAQKAGCHELILRLPDGYDSQIGPGGAYLSAGQRQRVGLARALYGDPNFIVLDEPNANLDRPGDIALDHAIIALKQRSATMIIIAHRPEAIKHCDKLLALKDGSIVAFGPRDEVLQKIMPKPPAGNVRTIRKGTDI